MKNKKLMRALVVGASIFALAGCGTPNGTDTNKESGTKDAHIGNNLTDLDKKKISGGNNSKDTSGGKNSKDTSGGKNSKKISGGNNSKDTSDGNDSNVAGSRDGGEMIAASNLQGSVIEFSDNGCTISPVTSDNDVEAVIAADGCEDEGEKVTVKYRDNCIFQRAVMNIATGKAAVSEAAKVDIKKKTSLLLYGDFDDTENFTAKKVVIVRYEQGE